MPTWTEYKNYIKQTNPELSKDIAEAESISKLIGTILEQHPNLFLTEQDLSDLLKLPPT